MRKYLISNKELLLAAFLSGLYLLTGFTPNPMAWPEQIYYRLAINENIQPENPQIKQLELEFKEFFIKESQLDYLSNKITEETKLRLVETFIESKIPYVTDFNNYFAIENIPSISRVLERGDDCDGIAIVTASLLKRLNYDSYVILGKWHSWIEVHLEDYTIVTLFDDSLPNLSTWYIKYNAEEIQVKELLFLEVVLHNFLLILLLLKTTIILVSFFRNHKAFQSIYTSLILLLLSPLPVLIIFSFLSNT
jgi:hypothetical protein